MIATLDIPCDGQGFYRLTALAHVQGPARDAAPALLTCQFRDAEGALLSDPPAGFLTSKVYGTHIHLGPAGVAGDIVIEHVFAVPDGTAEMSLTLHRWRARELGLQEDLAVAPYTPPPEPEGPDPRLIWEHDGPAEPDEIYELSALFNRPLGARDIVAAVSFADAQGTALVPGGQVAKSEAVGHFNYLTARDETGGLARFHAPRGAASIGIRLLRWNTDADLQLSTAVVVPRAERADLIGAGTLPLETAEWHAMSAELAVTGPEPIILDMTFLDADQTVLANAAQGLKRSVDYDNAARFVADTLERHDGHMLARAVFSAPHGAVALRWHMLLPEGGTHRLISEPNLAVFTTEAEETEAQPEPAELSGPLKAACAQDPAQPHIRRLGYDRLARHAQPAPAGTWLRLSGKVTRAKGGLAEADLALRALWVDAEAQVLNLSQSPGFGHNRELGLHHGLCLIPQDAQGQTARFETAILSPDQGAEGMFEVLACHRESGIAMDALQAEEISAHEACRALPTEHMSRPQLVQALDLATVAEDIRAQHRILQALSIVDPQTKGYAYRARILGETLHVLDPTWLPETGPIRAYEPDQSRILHLFDATQTDLSLADQQARAGLHPIVSLTSDTRMLDTALPAPEPGVTRTINTLPGPGAQDIAPADRLDLETRQHDACLTDARASLIHVHTDFSRCDSALSALALARAHGLPLICDLSAGLAAAADNPSPLFAAQRDRCLRAADALIVSSKADKQQLTEIGLPDARIAHIPQAVAPLFETPPDTDEVTRLRAQLALDQANVLGIFSTAGTPASEVIPALKQGLTRPSAASNPTLLVFGPGAEQPSNLHTLRQSGLRIVPVDLARQADLRCWYMLCDLLVPDQAPPARMIEMAVHAMALGRAVLLPDVPDATDLAGPDQSRATLFRPGNPGALSESLVHLLPGSPRRNAQMAQAKAWATSDRNWAHRIGLYRPVYEAARARATERAE